MTRKGKMWLAQVVGVAMLALLSSDAAAQQPASPEARLKALGIQLPRVPAPIAWYVPAVRTGNLVFLAGQGPVVGGKPVTGKVGADLTEEEGYKAARATILTSLAVLRAEIGSLIASGGCQARRMGQQRPGFHAAALGH